MIKRGERTMAEELFSIIVYYLHMYTHAHVYIYLIRKQFVLIIIGYLRRQIYSIRHTWFDGHIRGVWFEMDLMYIITLLLYYFYYITNKLLLKKKKKKNNFFIFNFKILVMHIDDLEICSSILMDCFSKNEVISCDGSVT